MTKVELLAVLAEKYKAVGEVTMATQTEEEFEYRKRIFKSSFYKVNVEDVVDSVAKQGAVFFKVFNEGLKDEEAAWEERTPPDFIPRKRVREFSDQANRFIKKNKPSGFLAYNFIEDESYKEDDYGVAEVWILESGSAVKKEYWIGKVKGQGMQMHLVG